MYKLIGAYFLTDADQDVGFPAFHAGRSNMLFTAIVDKELKILQFLPVIIDKFHLRLSTEELSSYSLGDRFGRVFFWIGHELKSIDVMNEAAVDVAFQKYADKPFVILQLARHFADQDRTSVFETLCTLEPSIFMKAFNATHSSAHDLEIARDLLETVLFTEEAVIAPFRHDLLARCRESVKRLESNDLYDFALGLLSPDDEPGVDRIRQLAGDRGRLLASVQARLHHMANSQSATPVIPET
jgi:hypothetical protein